MKIAGINYFDIANGPGIRVSLFVSGCKNYRKGCFNESYQDFNAGIDYTDELEESILDKIAHPDFYGLSLLGGDPLWQDEEGLDKLIQLVNKVHKLNKTVWLWTGFTVEEIKEFDDKRTKLAFNCDIIVDGRFELDKKDLSLYWKGSSNQRVIDVNKTGPENMYITEFIK